MVVFFSTIISTCVLSFAYPPQIAENYDAKGEDERQLFDLGQLFLQRLVGVDRKTRGGDLEFGARPKDAFQIISEKRADIVNRLHISLRRSSQKPGRVGPTRAGVSGMETPLTTRRR